MRDIKLFWDEIICPSVEYTFRDFKSVTMSSDASKMLLLSTAYYESRLEHVKQIKGPALGFWQMEPATHVDIWRNVILMNKSLHKVMTETFPSASADHFDLLIWNPYYACVMARIHYYRFPKAMPRIDDHEGMAEYYKVYYNTVHGKADRNEFAEYYKNLMKTMRVSSSTASECSSSFWQKLVRLREDHG